MGFETALLTRRSAPPRRIDHVAIVGGGFSGTLLAINLLRHDGPRVTLIERREAFARGVAYSTPSAEHLLNVRAGNMSALPDEPDHFERWLARQGRGVGSSFASRRDYGRYLAGLLEEAVARAQGRLHLRQDNVVDLRWQSRGADLMLGSGAVLPVDAVALALGNLPPHDPPPLAQAGLPRDLYWSDPWDGDLTAGLEGDDTVLILGTGLTMIDVVLTLDEAGFQGRIVALSRRGLSPRPHVPLAVPPPPLAEKPSETGAALLRRIRGDAAALGWREAIDRLRPHTQSMWRGASDAERGAFLRHARAWWDVHRHRLAPAVAARIAALQNEGRLTIAAGKIVDAQAAGSDVALRYRPRGKDETTPLSVRRIVNCTGPQGDLLRSEEPLLRRLLAAGDLRPDRQRLGIDVNPQGEVLNAEGRANPRLLALGPLTRGAFWEIAAVPDIRLQVWSVARRLSDAHWVEGEGL